MLVVSLVSTCPGQVSESERGDRPDPDSDELGWENGVWYDDPVDVNQCDGLDCEELTLVLARTLQNVLYEALFLVGEETDAVETQQRNRGTSVGAFSVRRTDDTVLVVNAPTVADLSDVRDGV